MAVFVDELKYYRKPPAGFRSRNPEAGRFWCHLFADTVEELHAFAEQLDLRRQWFQDRRYPHYDLTTHKRTWALRGGAEQITTRHWIKRCQYRKQPSA